MTTRKKADSTKERQLTAELHMWKGLVKRLSEVVALQSNMIRDLTKSPKIDEIFQHASDDIPF
jgi:hypothetical protein